MSTISQRIRAAIDALKAHDQHHHDYDDHDGYPDSELQTQHLAAVAGLESLIELKLDGAARLRETLIDVVDNHCIAMGAALIDAELSNPLAGMSWIFNTLCGPGLLPDIDEARRLGGAQAWFDAKTAESAELKAKRIAAFGITSAPAQPAAAEASTTFYCTANQLKEALEFVAPDVGDRDQLEAQCALEYCPARTSADGEPMEAGLYVWFAELPEEGCMGPLAEEPSDTPQPVRQAGKWINYGAILDALDGLPNDINDEVSHLAKLVRAYGKQIGHSESDDAPQQAQGSKGNERGEEVPPWRPMSTAPRDSSVLRLLVDFEDGSFEDTSEPCPTIGTNDFANTGEDVWRFAGWNWTHDCFTQGTGKPIGWLPLHEAHPATETARALEIAQQLATALEHARAGLAWYQDRKPGQSDGSDDEAMDLIDAALDAARSIPAPKAEHSGAEQKEPKP